MNNVVLTKCLFFSIVSLYFYGGVISVANYRSYIETSGIFISRSIPLIVYLDLLIIALSAYVILKKLAQKEHIPRIILIVISFGCLGFFSTTINGIYPISVLIPGQTKLIFLWISLFIVTYYYASSFDVVEKVAWLALIAMSFMIIELVKILNIQSATPFLLNSVYYILFLLPFVLLLKTSTINILGIFLAFIAISLSFKRAAMIAFTTAAMYYLWSYVALTKGLLRKAVVLLLIIIILTSAAYIFTELSSYYSLDWLSRMESLGTDGGAGRDLRWSIAINALKNQDISTLIIGNGYMAFRVHYRHWAHNDFLEILYSYGLIGLFVYFYFIVQLYKYYSVIKTDNAKYGIAFGVSIIIFLICSMFSMLVVLTEWFLFLPIFWGIAIGDYERRCKSLEEQSIVECGS